MLKKQRPATSTGVKPFSDQRLKKSGSKVLRTNYLDMYQKQLAEHKKRMSAKGNLSDGSRRMSTAIETEDSERCRSNAESSPSKSSWLSSVAAKGHKDYVPSPSPELNNIDATSTNERGRSSSRLPVEAKTPGPTLTDGCSWSTSPLSSNAKTPGSTSTNGRGWSTTPLPSSGAIAPCSSPSRSPLIGDPSARGIRQPGVADEKEGRQSTLMKDTAASKRRKTRRITLKRTGSGLIVCNKLYDEVKEMRRCRQFKKEELGVTSDELY